MFGYIRVYHPELKVKEYEFYRGVYCGLCRSMGKCTGQCSRMTLSYDFAFLALVRLSLSGDPICFSRKRCLAHPFKKRNYLKHNETLAYCASAAAILNYHKLTDDLSDEHGFKKLRAVLARPFVAHGRKKAKKAGLSELDSAVSAALTRLSALEKEQRPSVDQPAALFGELLGEIMAFGLSGSAARVARSLGIAVGKWIYIADALDDLEADAAKQRYNPFLLLWGKVPNQTERESIQTALKNQLYDAEAAINLMVTEDLIIQGLIENILYLGMPRRIEQICDEKATASKSKGCKKE